MIPSGHGMSSGGNSTTLSRLKCLRRASRETVHTPPEASGERDTTGGEATGGRAEYSLDCRSFKNFWFPLLVFLAPVWLSACALNPPRLLHDGAWLPRIWPQSKSNARISCITQPATASTTDTPFTWSPPEGPLNITLSEATVIALANNRELQVRKLDPPITSTSEQVELSKFDPVARAEAERSRERSNKTTVTQNFKASTGISKFFPTGTTVDVAAGTQWSEDMPPDTDPNDNWQTFTRMSVTQALLRGAGVEVNLATFRQARLDTIISQYVLTGFAQTLTAEIETAYWEYYLALGQIDIYNRSLDLAGRLLRETKQRIAVGQKARSEIYFFQAEVASREQNLIDAKSLLENTRLRLLRLISPPSMDLWNREL
jgi:outer membrane protein